MGRGCSASRAGSALSANDEETAPDFAHYEADETARAQR